MSQSLFGYAVDTSPPSDDFPYAPGVTPAVTNYQQSGPIQTNSFYTNLLVGSQANAIWTHPYSVRNSTTNGMWGLVASHGDEVDRVYGPGSPARYYFFPTMINEVVLGAANFSLPPILSFANGSKFGLQLRLNLNGSQYMLCPIVQGMGFVTAVYQYLIPEIYSGVGFQKVANLPSPRAGMMKYEITLMNGRIWTMYVTIPGGQSLLFKLQGNNKIVSSNSVVGAVFQVCRGASPLFDAAAGCYPVSATINATATGSLCVYSIIHTNAGSSNSGTSLIFALPHQIQSFTAATKQRASSSLTLISTTKGNMYAVLSDTLLMQETFPIGMNWAPFSTIPGAKPNFTQNALNAITTAAINDANADVVNLSNTGDSYFSGKILQKYAWVLYTCYYILQNSELTNILLPKMKMAIQRFSENTQVPPLFYETTYGGICSVGSATADYGNPVYNDHHFHYGYHILATAITCKVDRDMGGQWISLVRQWVNFLIRDIANPSFGDAFFPFMRCFDFYNGHSWAGGLEDSGDGKDEESLLEDINHAYAVKMWGNLTGDTRMEARGNLMLAIMRRSMNNYFYYSPGNTVEPLRFVGNGVSGILFDNKIDHTTYFGQFEQYIHGIHMLPMTPALSFVRPPSFVANEWTQSVQLLANTSTDGWKGILWLNAALFDPTSAYNFFNSLDFQDAYLDNGMSLTYSLAYCAGVGANS